MVWIINHQEWRELEAIQKAGKLSLLFSYLGLVRTYLYIDKCNLDVNNLEGRSGLSILTVGSHTNVLAEDGRITSRQ